MQLQTLPQACIEDKFSNYDTQLLHFGVPTKSNALAGENSVCLQLGR